MSKYEVEPTDIAKLTILAPEFINEGFRHFLNNENVPERSLSGIPRMSVRRFESGDLLLVDANFGGVTTLFGQVIFYTNACIPGSDRRFPIPLWGMHYQGVRDCFSVEAAELNGFLSRALACTEGAVPVGSRGPSRYAEDEFVYRNSVQNDEGHGLCSGEESIWLKGELVYALSYGWWPV